MTGSKFQNWRAVGFTSQGTQHLLCFGNDIDEVKRFMKISFFEHLTDEERPTIKKVELQRWKGNTGKYGKWEGKGNLPLPKPDEVPASEVVAA